MPCDIDIFDAVTVTPTDPDDDDVVIFLQPNKTVVGRTWGNIKTKISPDDFNWEVTDGPHVDGEIHSGEGFVVRSEFVGKRTRVLRNGVNQIPFVPTDPDANPSYVIVDSVIGRYDFNPIVSRGETIQIQAY